MTLEESIAQYLTDNLRVEINRISTYDDRDDHKENRIRIFLDKKIISEDTFYA